MNGVILLAWQTAPLTAQPRARKEDKGKQGGALGLQEDERRTITPRPCGITPTGQKQSASNQRESFFRRFPARPATITRSNARKPGYPLSVPACRRPRERPSYATRGEEEAESQGGRITSGLRSGKPFPAITVSEAARFKFDVNFDARSCRHSFSPLIALVNIGLSPAVDFSRGFLSLHPFHLLID